MGLPRLEHAMCTLTRERSIEDHALADVSRWFGKGALVSLILDVVSSVDRPPAPTDEATRPEREPQPRWLLTVLTYCYATGLYESADVERATTADPVVSYLCAGTRPARNDIRRFRRQHRELVAVCLARTLALASHSRLCIDDDLWLADERMEWWRLEQPSLEYIESPFLRIAEQRIDHAVLLDSMALDD
jgi:hypothetical protein